MSILNAIGNTPIVELTNIWSTEKTGIKILVKLEGSNPGGSVKDRPAFYMIQKAYESGLLTKEKTILEPTSGNTGIGMAMVARAMGFSIKLIMPACVSTERRSILIAMGAELELTPGSEKTDGAIARANHILESYPDKYYMPNQFKNEANYMAHFYSTGPEINEQTKGEADLFVAGMGTTGTLMGCSKYFKDNNLKTKVLGIEPQIGHRIQGLKNMEEAIVPEIYNPSLLDHKIFCSDRDAFNTVRELALCEGIFCGISSGAALWGAMEAAKDMAKGSTIVVLLPDRGDRYLSTEVFRSVCAKCPP
ncbi:MAG: cysteine synthase family protein [Desulforegulaceae bacterium]|nr:cysteine synthase family protein [Desulforegulaceae bacterium]